MRLLLAFLLLANAGVSPVWAGAGREQKTVVAPNAAAPHPLILHDFSGRSQFVPKVIDLAPGKPLILAAPGGGVIVVPAPVKEAAGAIEQASAAPVLAKGGEAPRDIDSSSREFFDYQRAAPSGGRPIFVPAAGGGYRVHLVKAAANRYRPADAAAAPLPAARSSAQFTPPSWIKAVFSQALLSIQLTSVIVAAGVPVWANQSTHEGLPAANEIFSPLLADPRETQLSVRYYRLHGQNMADAALGATWGLYRWNSGDDPRSALQVDVAGMADTQLQISGSINQDNTADYFANLPVEFRRGDLSGRFTLFHESSHLGDDYIRRTGNTGSRYSVEGARQILSLEPLNGVRLYGGGTYLLHRIPAVGPGIAQGGFELHTPGLGRRLPRWSLYMAQDLQWKEQNQWNVDSNTELGVRIGVEGTKRVIRAFIGHFIGHSPFGQFRTQRISEYNIGFGFDL